MPDRVLAEIEADIAEAERLISELRLEIAAKKSAGEDTSRSEQRALEMLKGWMLLEDQRQKALERNLAGVPPTSPEPPSVSHPDLPPQIG